MKKNLMILTMALMIALPVFGLAADAATPAVPEVQAAETTPTTPLGGQYGRRWNQTNPDMTVPQAGFVDADGDGACDICGRVQGTDPSSPNYIDDNKDGVCDHLGTDMQGQGQSRMQGAQGRGQGMKGRGVQGNVQGRSYADADNDGVSDNLDSNASRSFGHGRHRK